MLGSKNHNSTFCFFRMILVCLASELGAKTSFGIFVSLTKM
jgi:hypothetical protein